MVKDRLKELRQEMSKRGIDIYIVPTADFHESEYVGEHFKARKFITGFTGSAGTAAGTGTPPRPPSSSPAHGAGHLCQI